MKIFKQLSWNFNWKLTWCNATQWKQQPREYKTPLNDDMLIQKP